MKVTVNRASLASLISNIIRFTDSGNLFAVSGCLELSASEGRLTVTSLNEKKYATGSIEAEVAEDGVIMLNSGKLDAAVACFTSDAITVSADDKNAKISADGKRTKVAIRLFGGDRPETGIPDDGKTESASYCAAVFASVLQAVCAATAEKNNPREYLNTICMEKVGDRLMVVGTDSNALALCSLPCEGEFEKVLIPQESAKALVSSLESFGAADVKIASVKKGLMVNAGSYRFYMRGGSSPEKYPQYMRVIPQYENGISIENDDLSRTVKSISKLSESRSKHLFMSIEKEGMTISGIGGSDAASSIQEAEDYIGYPDGTEGPDDAMKYRISYELLLQCLSAFKGKKIEVEFDGDSVRKPLKIKQADEDSRSLVYVIMPAVSA